MSTVVLDSGGLSTLVERDPAALALIEALRSEGADAFVVSTVVLVEALRGDARDATTNRFLRGCEIIEAVPEPLARRAARLRARARRGSAVDALLVALAEGGGVVVTSDLEDLSALAAYADRVRVERV